MSNKVAAILGEDTLVRDHEPDFNVVIAYEDFADGSRAMRFFQDLVQQHGDLFTFVPHLWRFQALGEPELQDSAVQTAAHADMVVVASGRRDNLPREVEDWIAHWGFARKQKDGALVVLTQGPTDNAPTCGDFVQQLRATAHELNLRFFCQGETEMQLRRTLGGPQVPSPSMEPGNPIPSDWGLNQ